MFADTLRALRQNKGMTQAQLARRLGVSSSTVGMYEQGRRVPHSEMLGKIASLFGVSVDYLLGEHPISGTMELRDLAPQVRRLLLQNEGLMFNGTPLSADDVDKLLDALMMGAAIILQQDKKTAEN
ncbi:helix-turn-helix domain-containing protein [Zongyangia hominis]|uniref:Helix-turn-helix transcriptional regulator n=1 Tax=Zongyangia hominis TaxID=2763677 RepID=A0A926IBS8_9FIRM|nr:helix-turn-helix transcriptional regulator [Zongyangia hominis]MBC8570603.1 helix-turn-helix transcriptional regulator [Zongyangia hominis]